MEKTSLNKSDSFVNIPLTEDKAAQKTEGLLGRIGKEFVNALTVMIDSIAKHIITPIIEKFRETFSNFMVEKEPANASVMQTLGISESDLSEFVS